MPKALAFHHVSGQKKSINEKRKITKKRNEKKRKMNERRFIGEAEKPIETEYLK